MFETVFGTTVGPTTYAYPTSILVGGTFADGAVSLTFTETYPSTSYTYLLNLTYDGTLSETGLDGVLHISPGATYAADWSCALARQ